MITRAHDGVGSGHSPGFATRAEHRWRSARLSSLLALMLFAGSFVASAWRNHAINTVAGLGGLLGLVSFVVCRDKQAQSHHAALTKLRRAQFLVCPHCRFSLAKSISAGRCPERRPVHFTNESH